MLIVVLALAAVLQSQTPAPVAPVAVSPPAPASTPAPPPTSTEASPPEAQAEPVAEAPRTRQVCRFVELPGRRFPVRRCRTVEG